MTTGHLLVLVAFTAMVALLAWAALVTDSAPEGGDV